MVNLRATRILLAFLPASERAVPASRRPVLPVNALIKVPRQARSIDTVLSILDAAVLVLNQGDPTRFTTNHVAEVAGVSVGSLYQYFASKEALLAGVLERGLLLLEGTLLGVAAPEGTSLDEVLADTLTRVIVGLEPFGPLLEVMLSSSPMLSAKGIFPLLEPRLTSAIHRVLLTRPDARVAGGAAAFYVAVNGVIVVVLRWLVERPPGVSRDALVAALVRQCMAHVDAV